MEEFEEVDVVRAKELMLDENCMIVDIRQKSDHEQLCIEGAVNIGEHNIEGFIKDTHKGKTLLCYCYHGFSSQGAAQHFLKQGFSKVYSLVGGFEAWRQYGV